jgi:ABC-type sugar transport system ATPase subunit
LTSFVFDNLRKEFNGNVVVAGVNLTVSDGEFVVVVGPSGCGKTTTLRMLAGLEGATSGRLLMDGQDITLLPARERDMAMVFQNYALYPHMTVAENIGFCLSVKGVPRAEAQVRIAEIAETMEIGHLLDRRPRELSGGQCQRIAVCRAIVRSPKAFLFDEPLSNLDPALRTTMRGEIRTLQRRFGTTSVYVTHDQVEAMTMGDRIAVMRDGLIQQIDTPENLHAHPANIFVASFMGSPAMNLFTRRHADRHVIGVRPEHMSLTDAGSGRIEGRVAMVEMIGSESLIYVDALTPEASRIVMRVDRAQEPRLDQAVGINWSDARQHCFDAQTSLRSEAPPTAI